VFEGLDRLNWGFGVPPDTNGDVGKDYFIQTVNDAIGIFRKSDGFMETAFDFNTFMSQGNFGNLCDTNNFGDPVVLYDTFEDRWIITDFAFQLDGNNNVAGPSYQCIAASQAGDPLTGGWNFYSREMPDFLADYPKLGIWPDGLYMSANLFSYGAGTFNGVRVLAFNKAQMYAGSPTVKVVSFDLNNGDFTLLPSNARLQVGTPPPGRPNLFVSTWQYLNALSLYKFHVDWNRIGLSTFTGPDVPAAATSWPNANVAKAPQPGTANLLDTVSIRAMVQNQYTNFGGTESLWVPHTVRRVDTSGAAAPRWYQVDVSGGSVAANLPQAATWDPDGNNTNHRFMPSLAIDRAGNLNMGYSISNATTIFPSMRYGGRLAGDLVNTFSQTEQTFFTGTASQTNFSDRWGDYSSMTLDPDGCTFWMTNEYANADGDAFHWLTKFGSIPAFPGCTPFGAGGTVSGTVTVNPGGAPIPDATVNLGARSTTTDGSGNYSFTDIPAGTYPSMEGSRPGFVSASASSIVVTDGNLTTQNFALTLAPDSACLTDTTQADFQAGVATTTLDLTTSPGAVTLSNAPTPDQQNTTNSLAGDAFGTPTWTGQTFIPATTGKLVKVDVQLFCDDGGNPCTGPAGNLTLSVRNTSLGLPTGADLASATIPAFTDNTISTFTVTFVTPATLTSGTQYALILRPVSNPASGTYAWIDADPGTYANGERLTSIDSGSSWTADATRDYYFKTYIGYAPSGNLISSPKDANPQAGITPIWSTLSWNGTTPANTSLQFQVAGSNNVNGPFDFVGPDGTNGTFFTTSPVNLQPQFYNLRYLEYKAYLATTDSNVTPTLGDATFCFNDVDCSSTIATITPTPAAVCSNSTGNTASGPAGMTSYAWGITNGAITSATNIQSITYTAGASGTVTLDLTVTNANTCMASNSVPVTINPTPATPTITPGGPTTFCQGGSVNLSSSSATGNQWYLNGNPIGGATNQVFNVTAAGNYTVVVTSANCSSAASAITTVTVNPTPATPTITPGGATTFCAGGSVTLTSSAASGNQWYLNGNPIGGATNNTYSATASGNYTVVATALSCPSAPSAAKTVTVNPNPDATITTAANECTGSTGNTASVANAGAGATYNWGITNGTITGGTGTNSITYTAGAPGTLTLQVTVTTAASCSDTKSRNVTVNPIPSKPTITPSGPTAFPSGGSVTLNSSSATGNQWYLNGLPIGGATSSSYVANAAGNYTVVVTASGCSSPASDPTTVTICPLSPVVTNANDSGAGSLRQAILDVCDGGTITFDMNQVVSPINLTSADLVITKNLTITGPGANLLTVQRSTAGGTPEFRIFTINPGKVVTINGLTISNGKLTNGFGGGIFSVNATLNLNNCAVSGNSTSGTGIGGGISNLSQSNGTATMTITNSTVSGNSAPGNGVGGGIDNVATSGTATMTITNSTVSGNSASIGAGIANRGNTATLTITNGTISGNSADSGGGGIRHSNGSPITRLRNTIVAGNTLTNGAIPNDIDGTVDPSSSFNLIGNGNGTDGGLANGVNNNQVGVANALLAPLANYGGPTQTHALLPGSPALNAGSNNLANNAGLTTDQRGAGFNRIVNTTVDIGAFESRGFTISATSGTPQSTVWGNAFGSTLLATVSSAFAEPVVGGQVTFAAPGSGASATFTGGVTTLAVTINASNQATTNATANNIVGGPYNVSAGGAGITGTAAFSLTNTKSNQTITFNPLGNKTFGDADFNVSATASSSLAVSFTASGNCTISTNTVHLTGAGSCTITAKQGGDSNYTPAADAPRTFSIAQAATTTAVSSSANPSNLTQSVTFTATVSAPAGSGTPTGTVTFKDGAATISCANAGGQTLNASGVATCQTSTLTAGSHTITAVYSGDVNVLASTGTLSPNQVVNNLPLISFSAANYSVNESDGVVHVIVNRAGDTTVPFNVDYATSDTGASTNCALLNTGLASSRCDFDTTLGTLKFGANQTLATIDVTINQDGRTEGPETFALNLSNPTAGALLVNPSTATITINDSTSPSGNAIDDTTIFVRQQYHDFLNREPDAAGLAFWVDNIEKCKDPMRLPPGQTVLQCIETQRIITSAAFFLSIEFNQSGTFVRSFYVASLDRPATNNMPAFIEWLRDTQAVQRGVIVNQGNWQATLDANRLAFMQDFVTRAEFVGLYPTTDTPTQYINKLYNHALTRPPTATELSDGLSVFGGAATASDATARGQALLKVTQASDFVSRETTRAFVHMQYFGYLRRNPNDPPDSDFSGYNFWLNKLNQFGGDFLKAEMVKAFLSSSEYRNRFGN
jgi:hypothetical protein